LTTEALPSTVNVHYVYDAINRPTSLTYVIPDGGSIFSQPSSDNPQKSKPQTKQSSFNNPRTNQPSFLEIGHLTERVFRDIILTWKLNQGTLETIKQKYGIDSEEAWEYQVAINNLFRLSALGDITIASFTPTYSAASRILTEEDFMDGTTTNYTYTRDNEDQLLTASTPSGTYTYTYDERNNRLTKRLVTPSTDTTEYYTYNVADQMTTMTKKDTSTQTVIESYEYTYDNQGRRITKTKTSVTPNEVTSYIYYVGGNLKQITLPNTNTIQYQYDAHGNRTKQTTSTELITYHYSGAALQTEIHKDPSTLVVQYTLKYYPWGFTKTVGQNTVPYYYIFDHRGNTRAITDSQGDIQEEYYYSPYGILQSTPTITQPHFLSGNAQCQYDSEASLYYMHARYYDAITGRFLTKDSIPGSLTSTLSQNRYTYCQNDPITLIDPSGNSPENTGNPPRMSGPHSAQMVPTNVNPCFLPDVGSGEKFEDILIDNNNTCSVGGLYTDDGKNVYTIVVLPNGASVKVYVGRTKEDENGNLIVGVWFIVGDFMVGESFGGGDGTDDFIIGLKQALEIMAKEPGRILSGRDVFEAITYSNANMSVKYLENFKIITGEYSIEEKRSMFMKHCILGGYIASKMNSFSEATVTEYDDEERTNFEIGFWVSFYADRATQLYDSVYTIPLFSKDGEMGLIDIANVVKILAVAEHSETNEERGFVNNEQNPGCSSAFRFYDVMNVSTAPGARTAGSGWWLFKGDDKQVKKLRFDLVEVFGVNNRFNNIGLGVGILFNKLNLSIVTGPDPTYAKAQNLLGWLRAARIYNGNTKPKNSITYNHSVKLFELFETLYGDEITPWHRARLDDFDIWFKAGAINPYPED
jgi:RHS repeat-associated protein